MLPWESHGGGGGRTGQACCFSPGRQWSLISCCGAHQCAAASLSTLPSTSFPTLPSTLHVWVAKLYADQDAAFLSRKYMQVKLTTCPTVDFWELLTMSSFVFSCQCSLYFNICFHFFKHVKAFLNFLRHSHIKSWLIICMQICHLFVFHLLMWPKCSQVTTLIIIQSKQFWFSASIMYPYSME